MGPASSAFAPPRSVLLAALLAALAAACSQEGKTPTCEPSVTKDGIAIRNSEGELFRDQDPADFTKQPCTAFGRCYVNGNLASAIQCCCPALNFVSDETGKVVEHSVENGQCVRQDTNEIIPADRYDLVQCRYGFGEIELDTSGGAGAAGGSGGGNGGNGGSGGSGGG